MQQELIDESSVQASKIEVESHGDIATDLQNDCCVSHGSKQAKACTGWCKVRKYGAGLFCLSYASSADIAYTCNKNLLDESSLQAGKIEVEFHGYIAE